MRISVRHMHNLDVPKSSTDESAYPIPEGKTLRIDRFSGGLEYSKKETRVELVKRDGGADTVLAIGYVGNFQYRIDADLTGGSATFLVVRLVNQDSSVLNMAGWWEGVLYED